jgi:hypothetical protein
LSRELLVPALNLSKFERTLGSSSRNFFLKKFDRTSSLQPEVLLDPVLHISRLLIVGSA